MKVNLACDLPVMNERDAKVPSQTKGAEGTADFILMLAQYIYAMPKKSL